MFSRLVLRAGESRGRGEERRLPGVGAAAAAADGRLSWLSSVPDALSCPFFSLSPGRAEEPAASRRREVGTGGEKGRGGPVASAGSAEGFDLRLRPSGASGVAGGPAWLPSPPRDRLPVGDTSETHRWLF